MSTSAFSKTPPTVHLHSSERTGIFCERITLLPVLSLSICLSVCGLWQASWLEEWTRVQSSCTWRGQDLSLMGQAPFCSENLKVWLMATAGPGHGAFSLLSTGEAKEGNRARLFLLSEAPWRSRQETGTEVA